MKVNFVVPAMPERRFSAGMYVVVMYANGLVDRGHDVTVFPTGPGVPPRWFHLRARLDEHPVRRTDLAAALGRGAATFARARIGRGDGQQVLDAVAELVGQLAPYSSSDAQRRGAELERVRSRLPQADATIAVGAPTVLPTYLYGTGRLVHFVQNYEVWFADSFPDPVLARAEAELAYRLPLKPIAQTHWLARLLDERYGTPAPVCSAGIDPDTFFPEPDPPDQPFTVVSYGGRGLRWKGFDDAAEAIRLVRQEVPGLRWRVFGGASLQAENDVATYEDEGFVAGADLRRLYASAHVVLLPSWFEGFPYPPLEAMACARPVIATPRASELAARDGENALVVPPRDPRALADAVLALYRDAGLRSRLAEKGPETAREFTWPRSVQRFATLLEEAVSGPSPALADPPPSLDDAIELGLFD